jgi:hypothetical protein
MTGLVLVDLLEWRMPAMKTMTVQAEVSADQILKLEVPCDLRPGRVEVVLTIPTEEAAADKRRIDWASLSGLGREVWEGVDAATYLNDLRADRDPEL